MDANAHSKSMVALLAVVFCCHMNLAVVASEGGEAFARVSAVVSSCPSARTVAVAARSDVDCAIRMSNPGNTWRSFSFINGVCVLSESLNYAAANAAEIFRKQTPSIAPCDIGYEQLISARRFWVFQQRKTGAVSFDRNWTEYERGFGDGFEFWSGLQCLNSLTARGNVTLRMEMTTLNGTQYVAEWSNFTVGDACSNYIMQYSSFLTGSSNVNGDALQYHRGLQFSTFDRDNDRWNGSCSGITGRSGFWYNACTMMSPNGLYSFVDMMSNKYMSHYYIYDIGSYNTLREMRMLQQL